MGINTDTFHKILMNGFGAAWNTTPIPQEDTSFDGQPRLSRRSLDAAGVLGLVLHYLGSSMLEISLQQIFALVPSTVSCYLNFAKQLLLDTLQQLPEASISFPRAMSLPTTPASSASAMTCSVVRLGALMAWHCRYRKLMTQKLKMQCTTAGKHPISLAM